MSMALRRSALVATLGFAVALAPMAVRAQPAPSGPGTGRPGWMMGPGMMRGPGMWGSGMCNPRMAGFAEWRVDQIESLVKPTDAQRPAFTELRAASTKAAEALAAACPKEPPKTSPERLAFMETRMEAMLAAIKSVRPAYEAFYALLTDEQKARLDAIGPRAPGWHRWRWSEQ